MANEINERIIEVASYLKELNELEKDEDKLLYEVNNLNEQEIKRLYNNYKNHKKVNTINYLRKITLEKLMQKQEISKAWITKQNFDHKIPETYLGFIIKNDKKKRTKELIKDIKKDISKKIEAIEKLGTSKEHVFYIFYKGFNIPKAELWFCFYNKSHPNQKTSKQLFFQITTDSQIKYGLYEHGGKDKTVSVNIDDFELDDLIIRFKDNINEVLNDDIVIPEKTRKGNEDITQDKPEEKNLKYGTPIPPENERFPLNQILYGPPGTGKTFNTINKAIEIINSKFYKDHKEDNKENRTELRKEFKLLMEQGRIQFVTFHQSYGYEEFVEGIKPVFADGKTGDIQYEIKPGIFKDICEKAEKDNKPYVLIIDEINRGNISKYSVS